jgi:hypothetical protein
MITEIATFLAAPLAFYIVLSVIGLILFICAVLEKGFLSFIATAAAVYLVGSQNPELATNPTFLIGIALAYVIGGLFVGRFKWSRFLGTQFERLSNIRDGFLISRKLPNDYFKSNETPDEKILADYAEYLGNKTGRGVYPKVMSVAGINAAIAPKASDNKASIVMWIGYWPVYLVWYLIADICKDIGTAIYNAVGGYFQKMSNEKFAKL